MVDVYLSLSEKVTDEQRTQLLAQLGAVLSPSMELTERYGHVCVRVEADDPRAAIVAVQVRAQPIREQLGLGDHDITWSEEPNPLIRGATPPEGT